MNNNPIITPDLIRGYMPCSDPVLALGYCEEGDSAPLSEVLRLEYVQIGHRIWLATRPGLLPDRILRLWMVRAARRALSLVPAPDPRSLAACDVAERFADGKATEEELVEAKRMAREAWEDLGVATGTSAWFAMAVVWATEPGTTSLWGEAPEKSLTESAWIWVKVKGRTAERHLQINDLIALIEG